jgi:hypothetical protein
VVRKTKDIQEIEICPPWHSKNLHMKSGLGKCKLGRKSIFTSWHKGYFENGAISEIRFLLMLMSS